MQNNLQDQEIEELMSMEENMREAAHLSILEDVQDARVSTKEELINACYLLDQQGQDEDLAEETGLLAQVLYTQLTQRAHELVNEEIQVLSAIF